MKNLIWSRCVLLFVLLTSSSLACGIQSLMPGIPTFPAIPPSPSMNNQPTGSSPMSGDWQVKTDFGNFGFTVDPDGKNVTTAVFELLNWTCGGTTLTTSLQSLSEWAVSNGEFIGDVNLNGNFHTMTVQAAYDEANKQFIGIWEEDAHGTICSGKWESIPRK